MAERRMFAKTIIDSDAFLDMPQSSQLLYFHLSMRADDEGFINNPRAIMRNVRCTEEDILQLINKKFIIPFDNGIVVIKHWKIHNYIAKDRFKETKYKEEKATLFLDENKAYTQNESKADTPCIQPVYKTDTQDRIGKDRKGKDRIGKEKEKENTAPPFSEEILNLYHNICNPTYYPPVIFMTVEKQAELNKLQEKFTLENIKLLFEKANASDFLKGENDKSWAASFDWLTKEENIVKVLNGNFDNKRKNSAASYDLEAYERMLNNKDKDFKTIGNDEAVKAKAEALQEKLANS